MSEAAERKAEVKAIYNEKFVGNFTRKELDTLRATIARGTNDEEFGLFVQTCVNTGLNPFLNHIHCMVYDGRNGRQLSIQISSEGVLYLARKSKGFKGIDAQMVHENDDFKIDLATKKIIQHEIGFPRGRIIGGYCIARHEDFEDKILLMDVAEVEHMKKGRNANMWNTWFADMFKKHMLKRVAKEQYGIDLTEDEVQASPVDTIESYQEKPKVIQINEEETVSEEVKLQELWSEIESNVPDDVIFATMKKYFKGKNEKELQLQEVVALRKFIQLEMSSQKKKQQEEPIEAEFVEKPDFLPGNKQDDEISEFNGFFD
ncbi:RecT family recombinase [Bacillus sp. MMSF_3328]|uniref:RecT family recombinase n=1 Tax=Bacillus sp. MMSF_3328 TaxID=3047080 RepID=UPI00273CF630|nr:RecT family recombinase [Bacillus sp. MMSF_3328]